MKLIVGQLPFRKGHTAAVVSRNYNPGQNVWNIRILSRTHFY